MTDRGFTILIALLNSGMWQHERDKNGSKPASEIDSFVVDTAIRIDRNLCTIDYEELTAAETFRCPDSHSGEHSLLRPNGRCTHCGKTWTGKKWEL